MIRYTGNFTEAMKAYAEEKLAKLATYGTYNDINVSVFVVGRTTKVEITVDNKIRVSKTGEDYYELIVMVVSRICDQITRYKKYEARKVKDSSEDIESDDDMWPIIARRKDVFLEEMTPEEAIEAMELLGHDFFMYKDCDTHEICNVYRRYDGSYGILICK